MQVFSTPPVGATAPRCCRHPKNRAGWSSSPSVLDIRVESTSSPLERTPHGPGPPPQGTPHDDHQNQGAPRIRGRFDRGSSRRVRRTTWQSSSKFCSAKLCCCSLRDVDPELLQLLLMLTADAAAVAAVARAATVGQPANDRNVDASTSARHRPTHPCRTPLASCRGLGLAYDCGCHRMACSVRVVRRTWWQSSKAS